MNKPSRSAVQEHQTNRRHTDRLVMLSDGVFAIAITLSAIEIKPDMQPGQSLWQAWWLPLFVYFLCFFLIGQLWVFHRRMVAQVRHFDGPATVINLVLLSLVALMPVAIRFSFTRDSRIEMLSVYLIAVAIMYASMAVFWGYLAFVARLAPDLDQRVARIWLFKKIALTLFFAAAALYCLQLLPFALAVFAVFVVLRIYTAKLQQALNADR